MSELFNRILVILFSAIDYVFIKVWPWVAHIWLMVPTWSMLLTRAA